MENHSIDLVIQNQKIKAEIKSRNLKLEDIWHEKEDVAWSNRQLKGILYWLDEYEKMGKDRKKMEANGFLFPPVEPDSGPDGDWERWELWLKGFKFNEKIKDLIIGGYVPKNIAVLTEKEVQKEYDYLLKLLEKSEVYVELTHYNTPVQLMYMQLVHNLEEEVDLGFGAATGFCDYWCPGCVQRPWCDLANDEGSTWFADKEAGNMVLRKELKSFVSVSPVAKALMELEDKKKEEQEKEWKAERENQMQKRRNKKE